ncbi:outer membrane lipoprotein chaperone LolA [Arenimonas daejeonensis]|uniref:outer membrane lipoprotein chaperone LolA n=1 Tax=Arenimonas daejeonensis TaxID=370777 RepID=UPI0011BF115C|nr:outer membrane lipoprotein chaperone LolA [Arenimonas daejeonensis]
MKTAFRLITGLCLLGLSLAAHAGAREQLDSFSRGIEGLSADFAQRVFGPNGEPKDESSGRVQLKAPRQFRWEVVKPYPQLIVADGDNLWIYDPDLEQVSVRNQSAEENSSPLAVLIDPTELERQFNVSEGGSGQGLEWLELKPKKPEEAPFEHARLGFGPAGLVRMELFDGLGQRTVLGFSAWKRNPAFAADTFAFVPPEGVDVVGEPVARAEVTPIAD